MSKICSKCHKDNRDKARVCHHCGAAFSEDAPDASGEGLPNTNKKHQDNGIASISIPLPEGDIGALSQSAISAVEPENPTESQPDQESSPDDHEEEPLQISFIAMAPQTPNPNVNQQLAAGLIIGGRYRVTSWKDESGVIELTADDLGCCWQCGAVVKLEAQWCDDCGSEISRFPIVHLIPGEGGAASEKIEWNGSIYHIERDPVAPMLTSSQPVRIHSGFASNTGMVRDVDEDSILAVQYTTLCEGLPSVSVGFFAVCDGIGGADAGEVASRIAVQALGERILKQVVLVMAEGETLLPERVVEVMRSAVEYANQNILAYRHQENLDMGSTLSCALIIGQNVWIANVGDSRTYILHAGQLRQISRDHSLVAGLLAAGMIEADEVFTHPQRNIILRSLGDKVNVSVDIFTETVEPGDLILICCDGLWEMVRPPEIVGTMQSFPDPQDACKELVRQANQAGGEDNISVIVVAIQPNQTKA